jgi:ABC-type transport system substrate-binding protein
LYIGFNCARNRSTTGVRQAFNLAMDRQSSSGTSTKAGLWSPATSSPATTGYFAEPPYPYDLQKAKKLLAEAGYPNGLKVKFMSPQGRYPKDFEMAQALQQQWKQAGIDVTLETMEWAAYLAATRKAVDQTDVEVFLLGWAPSSAEARWILYPLYGTDQWVPKGNNRLFYSNKTFDDYVDKLTKATDKAERDKYRKLAQELLYGSSRFRSWSPRKPSASARSSRA